MYESKCLKCGSDNYILCIVDKQFHSVNIFDCISCDNNIIFNVFTNDLYDYDIDSAIYFNNITLYDDYLKKMRQIT